MPRTTRLRSVQKRLQYIQVIEELQEDVKLLQIPNEKLSGDGLNGLSYPELSSLESMLKQGLLLVEEETDKAYAELATMQIVASGVMGMEWFDKIEKEDLAHQSLLASRRTALRNKSRELRLSPQDSQKEYPYNHDELMLTIESLKNEKERLRLMNQRMIGKELDGMSYAELYMLVFEISHGMSEARQEMSKIKRATRVNNESISPAQI